MRKLHKKPLIMAAATLALTGTLAVGSAMAYFTTYTTAGGGVKMNMGFTETIPHETIKDGKHVTITNNGNYDCFVRVKAFAPVAVALTYNAPDDGWTKGKGDDDYWYYDDVLPAKATTTELTIKYTFPSGDDKPEEFNIVVIQECTPVLYKEDGTPYADWNHVIKDDSTQTTE